MVVGEGDGDAFFIRNLCEARGIGGIQVEDARGNAKFPEFLRGLRDSTDFGRLKGLLIVSDNDDKPDDSYKRIRGHLKDTRFPYAEAPLRPARRDGITVVVMMLPFTATGGPTRGCLETVLLQAVEPANVEVARCIDVHRECIAGARTRNQEDKFRMRSFIAALYKEDPNLSISFATSRDRGLVDLGHQCCNEIVDFLVGFPQLCNA
jgi:hypothetical protein